MSTPMTTADSDPGIRLCLLPSPADGVIIDATRSGRATGKDSELRQQCLLPGDDDGDGSVRHCSRTRNQREKRHHSAPACRAPRQCQNGTERRATMAKTYDAVIIGGGHNGLAAAFYLARAGFSVCVLERYHTIGGAAISEEIPGAPGYIASVGSYVFSLMPQKVLREMDLQEHGLEMIERDPRFFMPFKDGQYFNMWEDHARTIREIGKFSAKDAAAYPHYSAFIGRGAEIMDRYILRNPPSWAEFAAEFTQPGDEHVFQKLFIGSAADLAEYFFESPQIQAEIGGAGVIGTFRGPYDAGTGYVVLYHAMGMATGTRGAWAYVRGAMGSVTQAMQRSILTHGGVEFRTNAEVEQVLIRDGRATGVALTSGEEVTGRIVLSNADPQRTYLTLVERKELPEQFVRDIQAIQIDSPVMKINLAMEELPRFTALEGTELASGHTGGLFIAESLDYIQRAYEDARNGRPSDYPFMNVFSQSAVDPSVAPPGKHTLAIFTQYFPYTLAEGTWDERRDEIARHTLARFAEYAPNVLDAVVGMQVLGPPDLEARFGLTGGHIFQGELVPEQAFDMRPVPGSKEYEGPIHGLYLCGSGAWPGGCVMGAPGHNAAHEAIGKLRAGRYN
ncbi:MAG: NAD(P)/FAD-dependent oxidoreductase [Chloroflexi bacterium]|nr:MAG: NAD(P)/FAD-dependent oxidoreductase [Chloroflexota bacterium]